MRACVTVPGLKLTSPLNARDHWAVRHRVASKQRQTVGKWLLVGIPKHTRTAIREHTGEIEVTLTRLIGPRGRLYDDDNLAGSLKVVRDEVAGGLLGRDDGPGAGVRWVVRQERASEYGVRIEVTLVE